MSTYEMFKFWFIKEIGLPLVIIAVIAVVIVLWVVIVRVKKFAIDAIDEGEMQ